MAFRVELSPQAFDDLDALATYIRERGSFNAAQKWFNAIFDSIHSLKELPSRCPIADESAEAGIEVRLLLHGKRNQRYKVYFAIEGETVRVFHVRHWALKALPIDELQDLMDEQED